MATTDGLTGLANRRVFTERFTEMLASASRHRKTMAPILCDIDHFKHVNDTYGHSMGDQVLKRLAHILASTVRKTDLASRWGGEEFAVLLEHSDARGARLLAERIREDLSAETFRSNNSTFSVTMSLGIAVYECDGDSIARLMENADKALYHAKENGRNQTVLHQDLTSSNTPKKGTITQQYLPKPRLVRT